MPQLRFGIVGTGMIAGVIADAIDKSTNGKLIAVSSRQLETAQRFVSNRQGVAAVQGLADLLGRADLDAVYVGIPSALKEQTALAAIAAGKHVLVDKPFVMDLQLLGTSGAIYMDDFVLDWTNSFAFKNPDIKTGYFYRTGMVTRKDVTFISTPTNTSGEVAMIENFAEMCFWKCRSTECVCSCFP
jgi:predicted dinucleotide-binding enzyme